MTPHEPPMSAGSPPTPEHRRRLPLLPSDEYASAALDAPAPTPIACLQCQLLGHRRMRCAKADACAELPHSFVVGPLLLLAWALTAVAFIVAVS